MPWQNLTDMFTEVKQAEEMVKKFRNTILEIQYQGVTTYGKYLGNFIGEDKSMMHKLCTKENHDIILSSTTEAEVYIPNPKRGLYNTPKGAVSFKRLPFRQHRRGLCQDTAEINPINIKLSTIFQDNEFERFIYDVLNSANQRFLNYKAATEIANKVGSAAMNREFGICLHPNKEAGYILLYEDDIIGDIDDSTISIKNKTFTQEVLEAKLEWAPNHTITNYNGI